MEKNIISLIIVAALVIIPSWTIADSNVTQVNFNKSTRTFDVSRKDAGVILHDIIISYTYQGETFSSNDKKTKLKISTESKKLKLKLGNSRHITMNIGDTGNIYCRFDGDADGLITLQAKTKFNSDNAIPAILKSRKHTDNNVLTTTLGPAQIQNQQNNTFVQTKYMNWPVYGCQIMGPEKSIFLPENDLAITAAAAREVKWFYDKTWSLKAKARTGENLLIIKFDENYYRNTLGIRYYAPLKKRGIWKTAPVVAMTWYGAGEDQGTGVTRQNKEWLYPQIDWVAEHLLEYAENLVFQLDADYPVHDDKYMREISDYIRSKGLIPGIWLTPYSAAPMSAYKQNPQFFLHGTDGEPFTGFGIPGWHWPKEPDREYQWWELGPGIIDVTNEEAVEKYFAKFWRKVSEEWNYDFFKIDGQPMAAQVYEKAVSGGGIDGYRKGLQIGRDIAGDKFINACWGTEIDAIGLVDGARTGPDTGTFPHAMEYLIRWNYLNNIAWWCDPDAAANLHEAEIEVVRLNAQARVLTGQQFLTDDVWTKISKPICKIWQQSFPMLDIKPANLYQIENYKDYDIFNLRIAKPWRTWDIAAIFNYDENPCTKTLDLAKLGLLSDKVHIFEYWSGTYLGLFDKNDRIERNLKPYEGQTFAIVPDVPDKPVLISTSRHLTAGALDLVDVKWEKSKNTYIIKGESQHLVKNDEYEISFVSKDFKITNAKSSAGQAEIKTENKITTVTLVPKKTTKLNWQITFEKM